MQGQFCIEVPDRTDCATQKTLLDVGIALACAVWLLYFRMAFLEKKQAQAPVFVVQVLSMRIALVVPMFALITIFCIAFPQAMKILEFLQAFCEGFCIYCFFKMVLYAVGPDSVVQNVIQNSHDVGCLGFHSYPLWASCQAQPWCLPVMRLAFLQFLFVRPIFILLAGIFEMKNANSPSPENYALFRLFVALGVVSLVVTLPAIVRLYDVLGRYMPEISPGKKVIFVKTFILLWVIQNNVLNFMHQDSDKSEEDLVNLEQRTFSFVVMVELFVISLLFPFFFATRQTLLDKVKNNMGSHQDFAGQATLDPFVWSVMCVWRYTFSSVGESGNTLTLFPGTIVARTTVIEVRVSPNSQHGQSL